MTHPEISVWVLPATDLGGGERAFPWSLDFVREPRLIPQRDSGGPGNSGSASFRLLRATRDDDGTGVITAAGNVVEGAYIAIVSGPATTFADVFTVTASLLWWGTIARINQVHLAGGADVVGSVEALGIGALLDGVQLSGWQQLDGAGGVRALESPPTANLGEQNGQVIGNAGDFAGVPVFVRTSAACSSSALWQRSGLLRHVLAFCTPARLPTIYVETADAALIDDGLLPEVLDVRSASLRGAFDLLVARTRSVTWVIIPQDDGTWRLAIRPQVTPGTGLTIALDETCIEYQTTIDGSGIYDAVSVVGSPVVVCGTISYSDGNMDRGWTSAQETAYRTGVARLSTEKLSTWYERNAQLRARPELSDVFTRLQVVEPASFGLPIGDVPGETPGTGYFFPELTWNGTTLSASAAVPRDPYFPTLRLGRTLPWPEGVAANGTDSRSATAKAKPTYLAPKVFANIGGTQWQDLSVPFRHRGAPSIGIDDRLPALTVQFSPATILAAGHWSAPPTNPPSENYRPDLNGTYNIPALNWQLLAMTVAMESDQRLTVRKLRPGVVDANVRRELFLSLDQLQAWMVRAGTILGVKNDGTADRVAADTFTRNDYPIAEKIATRAAAWYFRPRTALSLTVAGIDGWTASDVGLVVDEVIDGAVTTPIATAIESVEHDYTVTAPRTSISTRLPDAPDFSGGGGGGQSCSPNAGGGVSLSLGGTLAQAVKRAGDDVGALAADVQRLPMASPRAAQQQLAPSALAVTVYQTGHGFAVYDPVIARNATTGSAAYERFDSADYTDDSVTYNAGSGLDHQNPVVGIVSRVIDADHFEVTYHGLIPASPGDTGNDGEPGQVGYDGPGGMLFPSGFSTDTWTVGMSGSPSGFSRAFGIQTPHGYYVLNPLLTDYHRHALRRLTDVDYAGGDGIADARVLTYDGAAGMWVPKIPSGGGGGFGAQTANTVYSGPASGAAAVPTFRALVSDDIPALSTAKLTTGQLALARGGTGADLSGSGPGFVRQSSSGAALSVTALLVADLPTGYAWADLSGVPSTFPPSSHTHTMSGDVTGSLGATVIANDAVTTAKILDANVTASKLASNSVTTAKIGNGEVTKPKLSFTALDAANNLSDVANAATARANLGIGTVAPMMAGSAVVSGGSLSTVVFGTSGTGQFNTSGGAYSSSTGVFTAPATGVYEISIAGFIKFNSVSGFSDDWFASLQLNGTEFDAVNPFLFLSISGGGGGTVLITHQTPYAWSGLVSMTSGDEFRVQQGSVVPADGGAMRLSILRVS